MVVLVWIVGLVLIALPIGFFVSIYLAVSKASGRPTDDGGPDR